MKRKPRKSPYLPTLKTYVAVPITDPAEIAALERRIEEAEKMLAGTNGEVKRPRSSKKQPSKRKTG